MSVDVDNQRNAGKLRSLNRFLKFFGKYITYIGLFVGVGGIVYAEIIVFVIGLLMVTLGCVAHEFNE